MSRESAKPRKGSYANNWRETMSDQEIIALFDSTNITLSELSRLSGRPVPALKKLLMGA
jgi:predicted HTH domain antitoxin